MANKIKLGDYNRLRVVKKVDFGMYLDGGDEGEILLPTRYVPEGLSIGDEIDVFIYLDQEERIIATTETPLAKVGDFAYLEVKWVNEYGAFLGWGLMKDIFCPFREQKTILTTSTERKWICSSGRKPTSDSRSSSITSTPVCSTRARYSSISIQATN